ncbi:MAG: hypothetical protein KAJ93_01000 [Methanosarcinales archaeon]|nr:hypothetical protein [Methanosarcinales archaeon]
MNTSKKNIKDIIILGYDDEPKIIKELNNLINKMNESQLKELLGYLYISQVSTYQMIYDYAEEIEII